MSQYPVEIPYSFSVDLDIREAQIPFVKTAILTDNLPEEPIDFAPTTKSFNYRDTFYVYGDNTLLYFGDAIIRDPTTPIQRSDGWIREKWRAKYLVPENYYGYNFVNWHGTNIKNRLGWVEAIGEYYLRVPITDGYATSELALAALPYSTLTVKRNTGLADEPIASGSSATIFGSVLTDAGFSEVVDGQRVAITSGTGITPGLYKIISHTSTTLTLNGTPGNNTAGDVVYSISDSHSIAQGVNPDYDVPDYYTFPNLTKCEYNFEDNGYSGEASSVSHYTYSLNNPARSLLFPIPTENINMSKVWLQIGVSKYRLRIYGKFYKWTNKKLKSTQTYPIATYIYTPYSSQSNPPDGDWTASYEFSSKVESIGTLKLYEPTAHPCNVRLLVNYVNNSGQNEVREYSV